MADDSVLDEIQDNAREAGQRLRASHNLMRSQGVSDDGKYRELITRLSTALAMTEAAYLEARRRREMSRFGVLEYRGNAQESLKRHGTQRRKEHS